MSWSEARSALVPTEPASRPAQQAIAKTTRLMKQPELPPENLKPFSGFESHSRLLELYARPAFGSPRGVCARSHAASRRRIACDDDRSIGFGLSNVCDVAHSCARPFARIANGPNRASRRD